MHLSCNIARSEFLALSALFTCPVEFHPNEQSYSMIFELIHFKSSFSEQLSKSDLSSTLLLPALSTNEAASMACVFMSHSKSNARYLSRIFFIFGDDGSSGGFDSIALSLLLVQSRSSLD